MIGRCFENPCEQPPTHPPQKEGEGCECGFPWVHCGLTPRRGHCHSPVVLLARLHPSAKAGETGVKPKVR